MTLAALALGLAIGLVMGTLGGGGSVLSVPALVLLLGLGAAEATTASLVIVGTTAAVATVGHARRGTTRWRDGLLLAACGVPTAVLASRANRAVDEDVVLLAFAGLLVVTAAGMLLRGPVEHRPAAVVSRRGLRIAGTGAGVGALTGFFGVGGGFVVVPALVLALAYPLAEAVGTSLLVIALNAAVALAARVDGPAPEWDVVVPFTAAAVLAALTGARASSRLPADLLTRAFAVLLLVVAGWVGVRVAR